jgi:hypothetical protein
VFEIIKVPRKTLSAFAMRAPGASRESEDEGGNNPSISERHENAEPPVKNCLSLVWLGLAKQIKQSDSNRDTRAATEQMDRWPPIDRLPVEAAHHSVERRKMHLVVGFPYTIVRLCSETRNPRPAKPRPNFNR